MAMTKIRDAQIKTDVFLFGTASEAAAVTIKGGTDNVSGILTIQGDLQVRNITVTGTTNTVNVQEITTDLLIGDELNVNGNARLGDAGTDAHRIIGSLAIEQGQITTWYDASATPVTKVTIDGATGNTATQGTLSSVGNTTLASSATTTIVVGADAATTGTATIYKTTTIGSATNKKDLTVTGDLVCKTLAVTDGGIAISSSISLGAVDGDVVTLEGTLVSGHTSGSLEFNDAVHITGNVVISTASDLEIYDASATPVLKFSVDGATGNVAAAGTVGIAGITTVSNDLIVNAGGDIIVKNASAVTTCTIDTTGDITTYNAGDPTFTVDSATGNVSLSGTVDNVEISTASNYIPVETSATAADGLATTFLTVASTVYLTGKITVHLNGMVQRVGAGYDYTENVGKTGVIFNTAPLTGDWIAMTYFKVV